METLKQNYNKLVKETLTVEDPRLKKEKEATEMEQKIDLAKSQDFFQNNKVANHQKKMKYTTTRIKSRNFLSNIAYIGINEEDYYNKKFHFRCLSFIN